jgi:uncharacterized RDD family membrane protein YckC
VTTPPNPGQYGGQPAPYGGQGQYGGQYPPGQPGGQYNPDGYNPYGQGGYGQGYGYGYAPPGQLAGWPIRVGASLLDSLIASIPMILGTLVGIVVNGGQEELGTAGGIFIAGGYLLTIGIAIWNRIIQQGRTGQSFGKKVCNLKIVHAQTGQLIGVGSTFGREICATFFNNICPLNVLWPLWDEKQQTWHDKIVNDIVIRT